jgi:predicted RNase H-like HicB family nuclease
VVRPSVYAAFPARPFSPAAAGEKVAQADEEAHYGCEEAPHPRFADPLPAAARRGVSIESFCSQVSCARDGATANDTSQACHPVAARPQMAWSVDRHSPSRPILTEVNPTRLLVKVAAGHRYNVRFRDLETLVAAFGFRLARVEGSHHMRDYHINIFYSEEDGGYIADIPDLDACSAFGASADEALAEVERAKAAWIGAAREAGKEIPESRYRPVIYQTR